MAPIDSRNVPATIGRAVAFVAFLLVCLAGATWFVEPTLIWTTRLVTAHQIRLNAYAEVIGALAATAIMVRAIDMRSWGDVGLSLAAARFRTLLTGFCIGAATNGATCVVLVGFGLLRFNAVAADTSWIAAAFRVTLVLLPAALGEELVCRGYLLTVIRDSVGASAAVLLTSIMFGLLHVLNPGATVESVVDVAIAGVLLGAVRIAFDSLYAAWMAHFAWNWVMAVPFHASVSGIQFEMPGYQAVSVGRAWLSGGAWGPEGGLIAAFGMMGGLAYLYTRRRREES
jgi:membrane protease YdiL (CAAX protease family)